MKNLILTTLLILLASISAQAQCSDSDKRAAENLRKHVYGWNKRFGDVNNRSNVRYKCDTVTGRVKRVFKMPDGDMKLQIELDESNVLAAQRGHLNLANFLPDHHGWLTVEVVCIDGVRGVTDRLPSDQEKHDACVGYNSPYDQEHLKNLYEKRVAVTGLFVTDMGPCRSNPSGDCHGWKEMHPMLRITKIGN
jgi:hypothetical protein